MKTICTYHPPKFRTSAAFLISLSVALIGSQLSAQELDHQAPSLQVGLDGLSFTKGTLDAQLIAEIIAEKQNEVKYKAVQNSFLSRILPAGGTVYNYADNVIRGLTKEPNDNVRNKIVMENTVNLVYVYALADAYVRSAKNDAVRTAKLDALVNYINTLDKFKQYVGVYNPASLVYDNGINATALLGNGGMAVNKRPNIQIDPKSNRAKKEKTNELIAFLLDIASKSVQQNAKLIELGLMRTSYSTSYEYLNKYSRHKAEPRVKALYQDIVKFQEKFTSYIGAYHYLIYSSNMKSNSILKLNKLVPGRGPGYSTLPSVTGLTATANHAENIVKSLNAIYNTSGTTLEQRKDLRDLAKKLAASKAYFDKIHTILSSSIPIGQKDTLVSDILHTLVSDIRPYLEDAAVLHPELVELAQNVDALSKDLYAVLAARNIDLRSLSSNPSVYIRLIGALYEFDKGSTFSEYRKLLTLLNDVFEEGKVRSVLSQINTFVKDYVIIDEDENGNERLNFEVESFLAKLSTIQSSRINRLNFHLTVGVNSSFYRNDLSDPDGNSIKNLSSVSEKIGLKYKLISKGDWWPRNPGDSYGSLGFSYVKKSAPKEPLISNWHLIAYGSGLLYQVANTVSNTNFDHPTAGVGTGITFFNALDFNVSVGIPLLENADFETMTKNPFVNIGWDIQFTEYLNALRQRRAAKKTQKILSNASATM